MKLQLSLLALILSGNRLFAQNNVGLGTNAPHASALLDVSSTTKGLLAPRMTSGQRTGIASPAKGLLVYDTELNGLYHYNGSSWAPVGGGGGAFTLPYAGTASIDGIAFKIDNLGTAIQGISTKASTAAISAASTGSGGYGVLGSNNVATGFGVAGYSSAGIGVYGFSGGAGTALRGVSSSGYGLYVSGNLRLSGGNTSPAAGAVLTSIDANGNAVWKKNRVGFSVHEINDNVSNALPNGAVTTIKLFQEEFDYGDNYDVVNGTFTAPVSGLYHFDAALAVDPGADFIDPSLNLVVKMQDLPSFPVRAGFSPLIYTAGNNNLRQASFSKDVLLLAGDVVWLNVYHNSSGPAALWGYSTVPYFSGHLVFQD